MSSFPIDIETGHAKKLLLISKDLQDIANFYLEFTDGNRTDADVDGIAKLLSSASQIEDCIST